VSNARDKRRAKSGVMEPLPLIILDSVFLDMPKMDDSSVMVMDNSERQSSFRIFPGCVGFLVIAAACKKEPFQPFVFECLYHKYTVTNQVTIVNK
jgi:hypothetical protein